MNWMALYPDGVIEIYSLNLASMKVVAYRNTVGNAVIAKNSLFVSSCTMGQFNDRIYRACLLDKGANLDMQVRELKQAVVETCEAVAADPSWLDQWRYD